MAKRLAVIAGDDVTDHEQVSNWDVHHWQDVNPVMPQPLCQLLTGCPGYVYHGAPAARCARCCASSRC